MITIGTPYRGSEFANSTTRWLGSKLITLPKMFASTQAELHRDNPDAFKEPNLIDVDTSIDSLAPDSPFLPAMLNAPTPPWVHQHTIIGVIPEKGLLGRVVGEGDGVVTVASAHLDTAESEITVNADHTTIHSHPLSVLEVHRILLAHLAEMDREQRPIWPRGADDRGGARQSLVARASCAGECSGGRARLYTGQCADRGGASLARHGPDAHLAPRAGTSTTTRRAGSTRRQRR